MGAPVGNNNRGKGQPWQSALRRALARSTPDGTVSAGLAKVADALVAAARGGDKDAWNEIGKRLDGMPTQILAGDPNRPLIPESILVKLVQP